MSLQPLLDAPFAVQFHVATVIPAALIGAVVFLRRKGDAIHRLLGKVWVVLMMVTSLSTFFINEINVFRGFSPIHLLSILTLYGCVQAIIFARRGEIVLHKRVMASVYVGGIVIAGGFTLMPGRLMHEVVFDPSTSSAIKFAIVTSVFVALLLPPVLSRLRRLLRT